MELNLEVLLSLIMACRLPLDQRDRGLICTVAECSDNQIDIVLDLIMNHTSLGSQMRYKEIRE